MPMYVLQCESGPFIFATEEEMNEAAECLHARGEEPTEGTWQDFDTMTDFLAAITHDSLKDVPADKARKMIQILIGKE